MSTQLIYNPGGRQLMSDRRTCTAVAALLWQSAWPDYQEHDMSKEVALIHKIRIVPQANVFTTIFGIAADLQSYFCGWRTRATITSMTSAPPRPDKWEQKSLFTRDTVAAIEQFQQPLEVEFDYGEHPRVADPYLNNFGLWGYSAVGGNTLVNGAYVDLYVEYSWGKATQANMQAYLFWTSQGE